MNARVPFTILTGFLGAGKTTILNRMLSYSGGRRLAVLVNELGRVSIDTQLILSRGSDVLELAGGCVCCKIDVKNDLWDGIADVIRRSQPDALVLETTGIAEPPAILEGLARHASKVTVASVVSVVDAEAGADILRKRSDAQMQVVCADGVILSKLDRATPEQAERTHDCIQSLSPAAERVSFPDGEVGSRALTNWVLSARSGKRQPKATPHHHSQITAVVYEGPEPLLRKPLLEVVEIFRERLLRVKGFVHLAGERERGFLELAGAQISLTNCGEWTSSPSNQLVFIGDDLDESALRRRLWACRARNPEAEPFAKAST
jgi:G3E family GTPase